MTLEIKIENLTQCSIQISEDCLNEILIYLVNSYDGDSGSLNKVLKDYKFKSRKDKTGFNFYFCDRFELDEDNPFDSIDEIYSTIESVVNKEQARKYLDPSSSSPLKLEFGRRFYSSKKEANEFLAKEKSKRENTEKTLFKLKGKEARPIGEYSSNK